MDQTDLFLIYSRPLEEAEIHYMATGSIACMLYGIPRFTHDLDLVMELTPQQTRRFPGIFPARDFYCPPEEVIRIEAHRPRRGHFNLIHHDTGFKADIYLHRDDPLQAWGLQNRKRIQLTPELGLWIAPPEYVILRKLEYYREGKSEKHLLDIRGMFEVSGDLIQQNVLKDWAEKLGILPELHTAQPDLF